MNRVERRRLPVYTAGMRSVADEFRERDRKAVQALSVQERIELALSLGEADLEIFCRTQGVDRATGIRLLRRRRQVGRTPSKVMQEID